MELQRYWDIVWRRLPVVLAVPLLVALGSLALFLARPVSYTAKTRVQLELIPQQANNDNFFRYNDYYNYLATEYAVDDLVEVLSGNVFQADVARTLQGPPYKRSTRERRRKRARLGRGLPARGRRRRRGPATPRCITRRAPRTAGCCWSATRPRSSNRSRLPA